MDSSQFYRLSREEAAKTSLWPSDMAEVIQAAKKLKKINGISGSVTYYRYDGEPLAVIWYDTESKTWLIYWLMGREHD